MMQWFGVSWNDSFCFDMPHAATPVGQPCLHCDEPIAAADNGVLLPLLVQPCDTYLPCHRECYERRLFGGVNHQRGRCTCCGGTEPPDQPGLSRREAARAAVAYWWGQPKPFLANFQRLEDQDDEPLP